MTLSFKVIIHIPIFVHATDHLPQIIFINCIYLRTSLAQIASRITVVLTTD